MGNNWERDINILETILKNTAKMEKSEIEALVGILNLKKENNEIDKLSVTLLEDILTNNKNLSDESMKKTRDAIMAEFEYTAMGGAKRKKKRRKTKRKKSRKSKRKRTRKRRRKSMRKRRRKKTR